MRFKRGRRNWRRPRRWISQKIDRPVKGLSGGNFQHRNVPPPCGPSIEEIAKKTNDIALSDRNLRQICEGKAHMMTYRELMKCRSLEEAFHGQKALVILYETRDGYGHWTCLFKSAPGWVQFFDSYGYAPDEELKFVPKSMGCYPVLGELMRRAGVQCMYSPYKLQAGGIDMATCGRWVAFRVACANKFDPPHFAGMFLNKRNKLPSDDYINLLTAFFDFFGTR